MIEGSDFGLQELLLMFQGAGVTLAITGPWSRFKA